MKSFITILALLCVIAVVATFVYLKPEPAPAVAGPVAKSSPAPVHPEANENNPAPEPEQRQNISSHTTVSEQPAVVARPVEAKPDDHPQSALSKTIDLLVSPQTSFADRQATLKQLRETDQLDQAIEALQQGAKNNPTSAEYPLALGEAEIQKIGAVMQKGGNFNETSILGMQADLHFNAALKVDPTNWEAQFFKAAALSHWPAELNKGDEVVQRFTALIDQQETMTPQPQFARSYLLLGEQYQKTGKADFAEATWRLGAEKFPNDPALQKKISTLPQ